MIVPRGKCEIVLAGECRDPNVVVWNHEAASAERAFDEAEESTCVEITR